MRLETRRTYLVGAMILVMALAVAGCGRGGEAGGAAGGREKPVVPTMPAAQFAQPTTMITVAPSDTVTETGATEAGTPEAAAASGVAITETAATTETDETASAGAATATPAVAGGEMTADQKRGKELYTTRKCGECHGANAEGVPDKGSAVAGTPLSLEEFTDLIRTGGEIGPDHLFGPMTISPSGVTVIHAWLQSLPAE